LGRTETWLIRLTARLAVSVRPPEARNSEAGTAPYPISDVILTRKKTIRYRYLFIYLLVTASRAGTVPN
jgi:hypothetical protein